MQTYQNTRYALTQADELYKALTTLEYINETEMYNQSVTIEPKEKKSVKKKTTVGAGKPDSDPELKKSELD
jgi:hypothetical protein